MTKKIWIDIIRQYVRPVEQKDEAKLHEIPAKDDKEGFIEVFIRGSEHLDGGGSNRFIGSAVEIDSEDFLVLHHNRAWSGGGGKMTVSYVLWRDIRSVKFFWISD